MAALLSDIDPDGLLEYSVVFSDRSLNHMSVSFQDVMKDISKTLKHVYNATSVAIVPGGGTYGMEAVARQFATGKSCLVIRNGLFSYRWSQIFKAGKIPENEIVMKARPVRKGSQAPFSPASITKVVETIATEKPHLVFAPHVETASGIILPQEYMRAISDAIHNVGGLFVLDCVASGTVWVDMQDVGVDVLISAPQKGWSASPCSALVMLSELARQKVEETESSSFAADLKKWLQIMETYESGGHAYHATMPTDSIKQFHASMKETETYGFDKMKEHQKMLGQRVRELMRAKGFESLAADGYGAPGVVVAYTDDPDIQNGSKFAAVGVQTAAGVPLMCDEPPDFRTFRVGLFGLDKLLNINRTVDALENSIDSVTRATNIR